MKPWLTGGILAFILLLVLGAGCTGTPGTPPTPTPTPAPVTTQTTLMTPVITTPAVDPMEPQPTQVVPNGWTTILTVSRNPSTYQPDIIVIYGGGTGQYVLQELKVLVTHPDGSVQTRIAVRPPGESISAQTTMTVPQSVNEPVRVQVLAMYSGIVYSVYDQVMQPV
jgi:hypothetical protein